MTDAPVAPASSEPTLHELERKALGHVWLHGWEHDWDELSSKEFLKVFRSASGCTLTDVRGREFLDGLAGLFVVAVGHGREAIADAMARQAREVAYVASTFYSSVASVTLAETLAELIPPGLDRIFLCSGGSEAVETALKVAKQAQALRGFPKRYKIIARRGGYHGMTFGAMSLTAARNERYFGPFMQGVSFVPSPDHYRGVHGRFGLEGDMLCAECLEQEILSQDPETVAAFIGEPISASNGTHIPTPQYWQEVRRICDKYGVLLILDEVITGFGRTGSLFASSHFGIEPDIMTMAKGLSSGYAPIGAVAVTPAVFESFTAPGQPFGHLLTFGGHAVSAAAASKNIEILLDEELVHESEQKGAYLVGLLQELAERHPTVGDTRGLGLLAGLDLVKSEQSRERWGVDHPFIKRLHERVHERGLLTRVWDVLHLAPPLVVTTEELDRMVGIIDDSLTEVEAEFQEEIDASG